MPVRRTSAGVMSPSSTTLTRSRQSTPIGVRSEEPSRGGARRHRLKASVTRPSAMPCKMSCRNSIAPCLAACIVAPAIQGEMNRRSDARGPPGQGSCRLFITNRAFRESYGNVGPILFWLNLDSRAEVDELFAPWTTGKGIRSFSQYDPVPRENTFVQIRRRRYTHGERMNRLGIMNSPQLAPCDGDGAGVEGSRAPCTGKQLDRHQRVQDGTPHAQGRAGVDLAGIRCGDHTDAADPSNSAARRCSAASRRTLTLPDASA